MSVNATRSPLRLFMIPLSIALVLILAISAACGGDDDDDGGGDSEPTATQSGGGERTPAATGGGDNGGSDNGGDSLSELEQLAGEYQGADGVVTYEIVDEGGSGGTWTIYTQGDKSRIDFVDESGTFISITTPDASYTCSEAAGEGFCFEGEGGIGSNPFAGLFTSFASYEAIEGYLDVFGDVDVDRFTEDVAGVEATCFTATGDFDGDGGTVKWCFSEDGMLLLSSYDLESGLFEMKAVSFDSDVPADAFDPPYEIADFGQ